MKVTDNTVSAAYVTVLGALWAAVTHVVASHVSIGAGVVCAVVGVLVVVAIGLGSE